MMRTTALLLLAAAALYFGAVATPSPEDRTPPSRPLDFEGIRTLEVRAPDPVQILLSDLPPKVLWEEDTPDGVQVERIGDTLRLTATSGSYRSIDVRAPRTLGRLVIDRAYVRVEGRAGRVAIEARGSLEWEGDAEALDFRHVGRPCASGECPRVSIQPGADTELTVAAEFAGLDLHLPVRTQAARIRLGNCAALDLHGVRRLDAVVIESLPRRPCPDPKPERPVATARIAP